MVAWQYGGMKKMRYRSKVPKRKSNRIWRRGKRISLMNRTRTGTRRGGTRL